MLQPEEIIEKFLPIIQEKYPNMTYEELNLIVRSPFIFLRKQMEKTILPQIRFKYWGVFKVKEKRLANADRIAQLAITKGKLTENKKKTIQQILKVKNEE